MTDKFTPGPWKAECIGKHWNNPDIENWIITYTDDGERIVDHVYEAADAHLIAAAPDLLQALEAMLDADRAYEYGGYTESELAAIKQSRAAIAKARGV